jgi:type IV secretory pathway ATPase VirB11/archaellum biosynthesis ATPase
MEILHITPSSGGYEVVTLLANNIAKNNHLAAIMKSDGKIYWTGGFLINKTPLITKILDGIPKWEQYQFIKDFKSDPFVQMYLEE